MKPIKATQKVFDNAKLTRIKSELPNINDVSYIIDYEAFIYINGKLIAIYKKVNFSTVHLRQACQQLNFNKQVRSSGIVSQSININASPRRPHLDNRCWQAKLKREKPQLHEIFEQTAQNISKEYRRYFKKRFANQVKQTYSGHYKVSEAYRIRGTPFTGGVINKNSSLPYHNDLSNTKDGISCMIVLKKGVAGGELILPELGLGFACQDNYMLLFDGKQYLHGVTPILKRAESNAYRYSIVNYNNSGMELCLPPDLEDLHYQNHLETQSFNKRNRNHGKNK